MKTIFGIFLFAAIAFSKVSATDQIPDILILNGDTICIKSFPLEDLEFNIRPFHYGEFSFPGSNCWRGYVAVWEVINDSLFLNKVVKVGSPSIHKNLLTFFEQNNYKPQIIRGRIFADWYSASLGDPFQKFGDYSLFASDKPKKRYIKLVLSEGVIIDNRFNKD